MVDISQCVIPVLLLIILVQAVFFRISVFSSFTEGAKTGLKTMFDVFPALLALITAIEVMNACGLTQTFAKLMTPVFSFLNIPPEISHLALIRPISGSGSTAVLQSILEKFSPYSFIGLCASVITGSTETTFYTLAVYFAATKVVNLRYTVFCALMADLVCIIVSCFVCRMFFS